MDRIDKHILTILQSNGRISNQALADEVALSPSPCLRRVKQLEEDGYIRQYVALLDTSKIGLQLMIMVSVGLNSHDTKKMQHFEETVASLPEVVQCYLVAGQSADYLLKVVVADLDAYQAFLLKKLTLIEGVHQVQSSFVLQRIVDKTSLPLDYIG
ncbi:MAG: Lrp/AsnC family transcriptional regulator [Legionellaceae bacterium]